jgi:hypothetical protein
MSDQNEDKSIDIVGFGKIAKAIPPKVYEQTTKTLLTTFQQLTAPITETTGGLGRYLKQKFDNMVDAEKAIATYTVEKALARAKSKLDAEHKSLLPPPSTKTFVRSIEEAAKETDPLLHEMWANLIASQLSSGTCHPHFVEILSHFTPEEAKLLISLSPLDQVGENDGGYLTIGDYDFESWVPHSNATPVPWSISCTLLFDFAFISGLVPKGQNGQKTTLLYRTKLGTAFLEAVSPPAGTSERSDA